MNNSKFNEMETLENILSKIETLQNKISPEHYSILKEELQMLIEDDSKGEDITDHANTIAQLSENYLGFEWWGNDSYFLKADEIECVEYTILQMMKIKELSEESITSITREEIEKAMEMDDLNEAMFHIQKCIGQTDGGNCGLYWSKYDDADKEWESKYMRRYYIRKYLALELDSLKI